MHSLLLSSLPKLRWRLFESDMYDVTYINYVLVLLMGKSVNEGKHSTGESQLDFTTSGMNAFDEICIVRLHNLI